jgi:hypothetical protein
LIKEDGSGSELLPTFTRFEAYGAAIAYPATEAKATMTKKYDLTNAVVIIMLA